MPPDPYERLQAARAAVKALQHERSTLAVRLAELARDGDEDDITATSARLDTLPGELLRAELKLARADHQAALATLRAAEASLAARVDQGTGGATAGVRGPAATTPSGTRDAATLAPSGRGPKGSGGKDASDGSADGAASAGSGDAETAAEGGGEALAEPGGEVASAESGRAEPSDGAGAGEGDPGRLDGDAEAAEEAVGGDRRVADEQWVRDCRSAAERAERRARELQLAVDRARAEQPVDEAAHRGFAKRVVEARDAIDRAKEAANQAELDLIQATELARVALEGLAAARAGADWRALEHARQARTAAAGAIGPAWEASRWAGLRVARATYELDRLVEERLAGVA
ncbi:MAG TPA: hypothetical protein VF880_15540 [Actinomycetes bacterium]